MKFTSRLEEMFHAYHFVLTLQVQAVFGTDKDLNVGLPPWHLKWNSPEFDILGFPPYSPCCADEFHISDWQSILCAKQTSNISKVCSSLWEECRLGIRKNWPSSVKIGIWMESDGLSWSASKCHLSPYWQALCRHRKGLDCWALPLCGGMHLWINLVTLPFLPPHSNHWWNMHCHCSHFCCSKQLRGSGETCQNVCFGSLWRLQNAFWDTLCGRKCLQKLAKKGLNDLRNS